MTIKDRVLAQRRRFGVYTETAGALAKIDAVIAEKELEASWELWDKISPVNGVSAQTILARGDVPADGAVYLIRKGERVVWFQPHEPHVPGRVPMSPETARACAVDQYERIITDEVMSVLDAGDQPETELEKAQAQKLSQIADARWRTETAPFYWAEKNARFDTSERSQVKYLQAAQKGKTQTWKTADGWVEMQPGDFIDLITAYETFIEELFTREATLAAQVQAAQTVPDVETIEW